MFRLDNACYRKDYDKVKELIEVGADVNDTDNESHPPPLMISCGFYDKEQISHEIVLMLIQAGANVNVHYTRLWYQGCGSPLILACTHNDLQLTKILINHGANLEEDLDKMFKIICSLKDKDTSILEYFIDELKIDVNKHSEWLFYSVCNHHHHENLAFKITKILVEHGANVNIRDRNESTPLHYAHNLSIIKLLVEHGADVKAVNDDGYTVLMSCNEYHCDAEIIKYLIEAGVDINAKDYLGETFLSHICHNHYWEIIDDIIDILEYLIKHGADVNTLDEEGRNPIGHAVNDDDFCCPDDLVITYHILIKNGLRILHKDDDADDVIEKIMNCRRYFGWCRDRSEDDILTELSVLKPIFME